MSIRALFRLIPAPILAVTCVSAATVPLRVEVRARDLVPGEPLRIEVRSTEPLAALEGEFLGQDVYFVRVGGDERGELWSGWSMIGLDDEPRMVSIEVRGRTASGELAAGAHAVTIRPKEFPREELSVASEYVEPPPDVQERLARERAALDRVYAARGDEIPYAQPFLRPVPGERTSTFGMRRIYNGQPRAPHPGLDLRAAEGTPVLASGPGRTALARNLYYSGNTVILDHGGGLFTIYAHLSEIRVEEGASVRAGDVLGLSGSTGRVTGPHLHWGAKIGDRPFDPTALLDRSLFE